MLMMGFLVFVGAMHVRQSQTASGKSLVCGLPYCCMVLVHCGLILVLGKQDILNSEQHIVLRESRPEVGSLEHSYRMVSTAMFLFTTLLGSLWMQEVASFRSN